MSNSLEERLKTHSSAFDGLLSLIPAKYYYDDATQDQWQSKKKSKDEIRQNKKAKLDPDSKEEADGYNNSGASAKDVLANKAKNAKPVVLPGEALAKKGVSKKQGQVIESQEEVEIESSTQELPSQENPDVSMDVSASDDESLLNTNALIFDDEGNEIVTNSKESGFAKTELRKKASGKQLSAEEQKRKEENLKKLKEKLANKINLLKEKRKAPGSKATGAPKSREQILEERRKKEEQRRLLKRKREEDSHDDDDDESEVDDNSDSDLDVEDNDMSAKNVLFQNIVFNDGDRVTSDLTRLRKQPKKKGPSNKDIKAHLSKLEQKKSKIQDMDAESQSKFQEKEKWNKVIAQSEGVKIKDDEKLLKKALKRKEQQKRKSEMQWQERKDIVEASVSAKAKRREENLKIRKENKGVKGKKQQKMKRKFSGIAKPKRAGFEGSKKATGKKNNNSKK